MSKGRKEKKKKSLALYISGVIGIVFLIYSFSLFRPWLPFDEKSIYKQTLFPIPRSFNEIFEVIEKFVIGYHIESANTIFSNHIIIRSNPIAGILIVITSFLFNKNAFLYHLLQLGIHLANAALVWCILSKLSKVFFDKLNESSRYFVISLLTLIWALHSANTEAVLLVTNWDTILTYTFCMAFIFYEITLISENKFKSSTKRTFLISVLFCLLMFLTEYSYTLPLIMFFIVFAVNYKVHLKLKNAFQASLNQVYPYFIGLFLFILISSLREDSPLLNLFCGNKALEDKNYLPAYIFLERNLFLVPQIFVHFLKLLLFPKTLSSYQSNLVHLSDTLIEPYSIFCTVFYFLCLVLPIFGFILTKNQDLKAAFFLAYAFFFALFPFLHILLPTYCLSADRYSYFPSFILVCLIQTFILAFFNLKNLKRIIFALSIVLALVSLRTLARIQEWNNLHLFYESAVKSQKNPLYKGHKLNILADFVGEKGEHAKMENYLQESLKELYKSTELFKSNLKRFPEQPATLKIYGLDYNSLLLKSTFLISAIRNDNYREEPNEILNFYEPLIKNNINIVVPNQLGVYAEILQRANKLKEVKEILEFGYKKFPTSSVILNLYPEYFLYYEKNIDLALEILQKAYKIYPNNAGILEKLLKCYEAKNDLINQAKYSYLLGLRKHSANDYLRATQIYLDLNQIVFAHKSLKKLIELTGENPTTLLLTSRYLDLTGRKDKILEMLNRAYFLNNQLGTKKDETITKSILISLVSVNIYNGNTEIAKNFLNEFERMDLTPPEREQVQAFKAKLVKN